MCKQFKFRIEQRHKRILPVGVVVITGNSAVPIGVEEDSLTCFNINAEAVCIGIGVVCVSSAPLDNYGSTVVNTDAYLVIVVGQRIHVDEVKTIDTCKVLNCNNGNFTACGKTAVSRCGNCCRAGGNALDIARLLNSTYGFIRGGPCYISVRCVNGKNGCNELFNRSTVYGDGNARGAYCDTCFGDAVVNVNRAGVGKSAVTSGNGYSCGTCCNTGDKTLCIYGCNSGVGAFKCYGSVSCIGRANDPFKLVSCKKSDINSFFSELDAFYRNDGADTYVVEPCSVGTAAAAAVLLV